MRCQQLRAIRTLTLACALLLTAIVPSMAFALESISSATSTPASIPFFTRRLGIGSSGDNVSLLQEYLQGLGYFTYPTITGYFGPVTAKAVANFQRADGLDPVGSVGPKTRALLNAILAVASSMPGGSGPGSATFPVAGVASTAGSSTPSINPPPSENSTTTDVLVPKCSAPPGLLCIPGTSITQPRALGSGYTPGFGGGGSAVAVVTQPTVTPSIPTGLTATAVSSTQINLSWNHSTDNVGVTGHHVFRDGTEISAPTTNSYSDGGLNASTSYSYTVQAVDADGNVSSPSTAVTATTKAVPADNLLVWSQAFDNTAWTKQQASITADATTAPDGTLTADEIVENTAPDKLHQAFQAPTLTAGATYTLSVYAKPAGRTWVVLNLQDSADHVTYFDIQNGVVGDSLSSGNPDTGVTATITPLANGWYRCSITRAVNQASIPTAGFRIGLANDDGGSYNYTKYTGDGTSGIYLWGAQLEQASSATAYIQTATTTSAVVDTIAPSAPTDVYGIPVSSSQVTLSWDPASDNVGVTGYQVFRNLTQIGAATSTSYTDSGLTAATTYSYTVRAVDAARNVSAFSSPFSVAPAPLSDPNPTASFTRPASLPDPNPNSGTLRSLAAKIGLYFGSMVDPTGDGIFSDASWFQPTLSSQFNFMEPGNQLKWWMTESSQGVYDFSGADALVNFAVANNMNVRGHNLLWGMANPGWLGNAPASTYTTFTGQQLQAILVDHIQTVMGHYVTNYPGVIKWWDVTNELMGYNDEFNGDGILWTLIGTNPDKADYVRVAFQTAHATDPNAVLCMNDYNNDGSDPVRTQNMINTVREFKIEGIPINCVGMEDHSPTASYAEILATMQAYAEMGVQVQVTEFDDAPPSNDPNLNADAASVASSTLKACVDSPNCTVFDLWGFSQKYPALASDGGYGNQATFPWDANDQETPEYTAMNEVLTTGPNN